MKLLVQLFLGLVPWVTSEKTSANEICPANEEWSNCGSACAERYCCDSDDRGHCRNLECPEMCEERCGCIKGYARDFRNGECIPKADCLLLPASLAPSPVPPACPDNEVYNNCYKGYEPFCCEHSMNAKSSRQFAQFGNGVCAFMPLADSECVSQCNCAYGFARDANGVCIPEHECPEPVPECPKGEYYSECEYCSEPSCNEAVSCTKKSNKDTAETQCREEHPWNEYYGPRESIFHFACDGSNTIVHMEETHNYGPSDGPGHYSDYLQSIGDNPCICLPGYVRHPDGRCIWFHDNHYCQTIHAETQAAQPQCNEENHEYFGDRESIFHFECDGPNTVVHMEETHNYGPSDGPGHYSEYLQSIGENPCICLPGFQRHPDGRCIWFHDNHYCQTVHAESLAVPQCREEHPWNEYYGPRESIFHFECDGPNAIVHMEETHNYGPADGPGHYSDYLQSVGENPCICLPGYIRHPDGRCIWFHDNHYCQTIHAETLAAQPQCNEDNHEYFGERESIFHFECDGPNTIVHMEETHNYGPSDGPGHYSEYLQSIGENPCICLPGFQRHPDGRCIWFHDNHYCEIVHAEAMAVPTCREEHPWNEYHGPRESIFHFECDGPNTIVHMEETHNYGPSDGPGHYSDYLQSIGENSCICIPGFIRHPDGRCIWFHDNHYCETMHAESQAAQPQCSEEHHEYFGERESIFHFDCDGPNTIVHMEETHNYGPPDGPGHYSEYLLSIGENPCICIPGFHRHPDGRCIWFHDNHYCQTVHAETASACPIENVCRCEHGLTRYTDPKTGHSWCLEECPTHECGDNEQWNECGTCEETKCCQGDNCGGDSVPCSTECQPRCECAEGYVRNEENVCVMPQACFPTTEQPPVDDGLNAADCAGTVDYKFRSGKAKVSRSGENSNLVRLQQAKVKETKAHTGFVSFPKSACGKDFLAGLKDGRVTVDFADKKATYSVIGSYYVDNGSSTQVVVQYNSVPLNVADDKCPKCLGNSSTDQLEMLVMGTKNIEWGSKTAKSCLNGALVGHAGAAGAPTLLENDESGCVAWTNAL